MEFGFRAILKTHPPLVSGPLVSGVDHFRLHHPRPRGVLRTQLEAARADARRPLDHKEPRPLDRSGAVVRGGRAAGGSPCCGSAAREI